MAYSQLNLPSERIEQLRAFAKREGVTQGAALAKLFRALHAHTGTPLHIPGIAVNAMADGVVIQLPDSTASGFSFEAAKMIAKTIREYLNGAHSGEKVIRLDHSAEFSGSFSIRRKGNGFKIAVPVNAPEKNFAQDVLEDVAGMIEAAIAKAGS